MTSRNKIKLLLALTICISIVSILYLRYTKEKFNSGDKKNL